MALPQPVLVNGHTPVVQAGSEIQYLGELRMTIGDDGVPRVRDYRLHAVNDSIVGDATITARVEDFKQVVSEHMLAPKGYGFDQQLAKVDQSQGRDFSEHTLSNLVTDALRHAVDADFGFTGNGTIRDDLIKGRNGVQGVSDLFRIAPLGIGHFDDEPGYPMIKAYFTAREIKSLLEVLLLAYQLRDSDSYYPRVSGVRFTYNPWRVPFDRISRLEIGDPVKGYRDLDLDDTRLYSIGATSYVGSFTWLVPDLTKGLLSVTPKDAEGRPLPRIEDAIVDQDPDTDGVQELKEWQALLDHIRRLPDLDGDGLADIPTTGVAAEVRMIRAPSLHPADMFRLAGPLQWGTSAVVLACVLLILWLLSRPLRRRR